MHALEKERYYSLSGQWYFDSEPTKPSLRTVQLKGTTASKHSRAGCSAPSSLTRSNTIRTHESRLPRSPISLDEAQGTLKSQLDCRFLASFPCSIRERCKSGRLKHHLRRKLALAFYAEAGGFQMYRFPVHRTCQYSSAIIVKCDMPGDFTFDLASSHNPESLLANIVHRNRS
jgi:hypothetical protein